MTEAGVGGGLTLTYLVESQVPVLVKTGEILREQLKKVGINVEIRPQESGQYFEELTGKKFDIAAAWWSVTVDPDLFYYPSSTRARRGTSPASRIRTATSGSTRSGSRPIRPRARRCTRR
jgi:ABC-type transport system substrate-binding protein